MVDLILGEPLGGPAGRVAGPLGFVVQGDLARNKCQADPAAHSKSSRPSRQINLRSLWPESKVPYTVYEMGLWCFPIARRWKQDNRIGRCKQTRNRRGR